VATEGAVVLFVAVVVAAGGTGAVVAAGAGVTAMGPVPGRRRQRHPTWGIETAVVGSRPDAVCAGKPRAPLRCRVPYWRDALPWRRYGGCAWVWVWVYVCVCVCVCVCAGHDSGCVTERDGERVKG